MIHQTNKAIGRRPANPVWRSTIWSALLLLVMRVVAAVGDVEMAFNPDVNGTVRTMAVQANGKIVIGGDFNRVSGVTRNGLARLNGDGTLDGSFNPNPNNSVWCSAIQADGKILIGGPFNNGGGVPRNYIARLNPDGSLDSGFNPNPNEAVGNIAIQPDGKIVIGGYFTSVSGMTRSYIARLNADGVLDSSFINPNVNTGGNSVLYATTLQPDGKLIICGAFTNVAGLTRNRIARLYSDGTLDMSFNPNASSDVFAAALQPDGKIIIVGNFQTVAGATHYRLARLNANGSLDGGFNSSVNSYVWSVAIQTDGKILIGGNFNNNGGGVARNRTARFSSDGALDESFNPNANEALYGMAVQVDGKILIGGVFTNVGGMTRNHFARLENDAATQSLTVPSPSRVQWLRGGASVETTQVNFDLSVDGGNTWTPLGAGTRMSGGWERTGLSLPTSGQIRAQARTSSGNFNGSEGVMGTVAAFPAPPEISIAFVTAGVRLRFMGTPGFTYAVQRAIAVTGPWESNAPPLTSMDGLFEYIDTNAPAGSAFYRASTEQ